MPPSAAATSAKHTASAAISAVKSRARTAIRPSLTESMVPGPAEDGKARARLVASSAAQARLRLCPVRVELVVERSQLSDHRRGRGELAGAEPRERRLPALLEMGALQGDELGAVRGQGAADHAP